ncbi:MAG: C25 family cysteine peptidase, partial [Pseudomonadota bacterium]
MKFTNSAIRANLQVSFVAMLFCVWLYPDSTRSAAYMAMGMHWNATTIDTHGAGAFGTPRALAFDADGNPGIAYNYDTGLLGMALGYAHYNGSSWSTTLVDNPLEAAECGKYASLAFDGATAHIGYFCDDGPQGEIGWHHAVYVGAGGGSGCTVPSSPNFNCEFLIADAPGTGTGNVAVSPSGIVGFTFTQDKAGILFGTYLEGSGDACSDANWFCYIVDSQGTWPALTFDESDYALIPFYVGGGGEMHLAMQEAPQGGGLPCNDSQAPAPWDCAVIVEGGSVAADQDHQFSIDVDGDGDIAILYYDATFDLMLAEESGSGSGCNGSSAGDFTCEEIVNSGSLSTDQPSMAITDNGPYISYHTDDGATTGTEPYIAIHGLDFDTSDNCSSVNFDCGYAQDNTDDNIGNWTSIAYFNKTNSENSVGIAHQDADNTDLLYTQARTLDVRINEVFYKSSDPDEEWAELYVRQGGNLTGLVLFDGSGDFSYSFAAEEVDTGDYLVAYVGTPFAALCAIEHVYCGGGSAEVMDNTGDDLQLALDGVCHDYVAWGTVAGGDIVAPEGCTWDGQYPGQELSLPNPSSSKIGYCISHLGDNGSAWMDAYDDDTVDNWEEAGAAGGPETYGPCTMGLGSYGGFTNNGSTTPVRAYGLWVSPVGAAGGGGETLLEWAPANSIETMAMRPMRKRRVTREVRKTKWEPIGSWQILKSGVGEQNLMKAKDPNGKLGDQYGIEVVDSTGAVRMLPVRAQKGPAPSEGGHGTVIPRSNATRNLVGNRKDSRFRGNDNLELMSSTTKSRLGPGPGDACRVEVITSGWVKMSKATLVASCPQVAGWNDLNVTRRGQKVGRKWTGEVLEFQANEPSSRYEQGEVYLLLPDKGADLAVEDGTPIALGEEVSELLQTKRVEEQTRYSIGSPQEDHFYWEVFGTGMPANVQIEVTGVLKTIRVHVVGLGGGAHRVEVWSGGTQLGASDFEGRVAQDVEIAAEGLKQPGETLSLQLRATAAVAFDGQYLDWVELDQEVELAVGTNYILDRRFSGTLVFDVGQGQAVAYDVTDPDNPVPLQGTDLASGSLKVGVKSTKKERTIRVVGANDAQAQKEIAPAVQISWPGAADYLVITDSQYTQAIAPLLTHREGQGLSAAVVEMDAIRDSVGYGYKEPAAIRAFLEE